MSNCLQTLLRWVLTTSVDAPPYIREIALNLWPGDKLEQIGKDEKGVPVLVTAEQLQELRETAKPNKISAIKRLREFTQLRTGACIGLRCAKDIIESL